MAIDTFFLFSGVYPDTQSAIDDYDAIKTLHTEANLIDAYDAAVIERRKDVNLGSLGTFTLPLASSTINETDTIVRVQDGNIVAIGGLMRQSSTSDRSQLPGVGDAPGLGSLFRQRGTSNTKSELVILLKPTIVHSDQVWQRELSEARDRVQAMDRQQAPQAPAQ